MLCAAVLAYIIHAVTSLDVRGSVLEGGNPGKTILDLHSFDSVRRLIETSSYQFRLFEGHSNFTLTANGKIKTSAKLDRETICKEEMSHCYVTLSVVLVDGPKNTMIKAIIEVVDINDNTPTFPVDLWNVTFREDASIESISPLPRARDADNGIFSIQNYKLIRSDDTFGVKMEDGDVYLILKKKLDREIYKEYNLVLEAIDGGGKTGRMSLKVIVSDSNDNRPIFNPRTYSKKIPEDFGLNRTILTVYARDSDAGKNGQIMYSVSTEAADKFQIDSSGRLQLKGKLDYEATQKHSFRVYARDKASNPLEDFAKITIDVVDVNEFDPEITLTVLTSNGRVEVKENSPKNTFVALYRADDRDGSNEKVTCNLDETEDNFYEHNSGKILTTREFDRETRDSYSFYIICRDSGIPVRTTKKLVEVIIVDDNDQTPELNINKYTAEIEENYGETVIVKLKAKDDDIGLNGKITFEIEESIDLVTVDSDGTVRTTKSLDREEKDSFFFHVIAKDSGSPSLSSRCFINIKVLDKNDNSPVFPKDRVELEVYEERMPGERVGKVTAFDPDLYPNNITFYKFVSGHRNFAINVTTGLIETNSKLDREEREDYLLIVKAYNPDYHTEGDKITVLVKVLDVNDNPPLVYDANITAASNAKIGESVGAIKASDLDVGRLTYTIESVNGADIYSVEETSGKVVVKEDLESYVDYITTLRVKVQDGNYEAFCSVTITIAPETSKASNDTKLYAIIAIICGTLLVAVVLIIAIFVQLRRKRNINKLKKADEEKAIEYPQVRLIP